jgi:hypothetical protein|tara:strand:+ start:94 stop:894 length:801 start_codon:yes stop_codon:yes gene_type:complete
MKRLLLLTAIFFAATSATASTNDIVASKRMAKIALMRCAEIQETRKMDSAMRVRIVNDFRLDYDLDPFLKGDDFLIEANGYGLCPDLILQLPDFEENLDRARDAATSAQALQNEWRQKQEIEEALVRGNKRALELADQVSRCNLRFAKWDIKAKNNSLTIWRKMFQGNKSSNCSLEVEGSNVALRVTLDGEVEKFEFRPAMYSTLSAPHAQAVLNKSPRIFSKKDKKKIQSIELVIDGFPDGYCDDSYQCVWPEGLVISKPIHLRD